MSMGAPGRVEIVAVGDSAADTVVWRIRGELRVSVVVKACFALEADAPMGLLEPEEILRAEVHHGRNPLRSVWLTSDLAPYLPKADVILTGHACAPEGQTVDGMSVRLAVYGEDALLDKSINVHGDRAKGAAVPFDRMPLVYERAFGGIGNNDNPFGTGAGEGDDAPPPNLVDPADPRRVACFAPIGRSWPVRRKLLPGDGRRLVEGPPMEIPDGLDFAYFQVAPPDQRVGYLVGNEWLVLEGLHPTQAQIASSLPSAIGRARVFGMGPGRTLALVADTLRIDGDTLGCQVVWRGSFPVPDLATLEALVIHAGVETSVKPLRWPEAPAPRVASVPPPAPSLAPSTRAAPPAWDRTVEVQTDSAPSAPAAAIPFVEAPGPVNLPPSPPPRAGLGDTMVAAEGEEATAAFVDRDERPPSIPFGHARRYAQPASSPTGAAPPLAAASMPAAPPAPVATSTQIAPPAPVAASMPVAPLAPFATSTQIAPPAPLGAPEIEPPTARVEAPDAPGPQRDAAAIEMVNDTPLAFGTIPWGQRPSRDCLTVIAKATCDLVPGGPAELRAKAEPLRGERLLDGAAAPVCVYPSDLAPFKVRADVLLVGHAQAPRGGATSVKVRFRLGEGPGGLDRILMVFGARNWEKAGAHAKPSAPERFLRVPLRYDHAFGGPGHEGNPAGLGFTGKMGKPGPLPHLEDPAEKLRTPRQAPEPACFAPLAQAEKDRRARAEKASRSLADALDWTHHQTAPRRQQLPFLRGDETFEIDGIHPQHPHFEGALPGIAARVVAERAGGRQEQVPMRLDTAFFDLDEKTLTLVWRGSLPVSDERSPDVRSLRLVTVPSASD
jgi:hypothetical protein